MQRLRLNAMRDFLVSSMYEGARARVLEEFLRCNAQVYVFAGAIRDAIASHYEGLGDGIPRDFDIGVSNVKREVFDSILSECGVQNRHRGYVLHDGIQTRWDVWRLEETIGLRKTNTVCCVENVLRSFNLSCNAIALEIRSGLFIDAGAIEAIRRQRLSFVRNAIVHSETTFAAKALLVQLRFGYCTDESVQLFIGKHLEFRTLVYESKKVFPGFVALELSPTIPPTDLCGRPYSEAISAVDCRGT